MRISLALSHITIICHMFVLISFPTGKRRIWGIVLGFYRPLNIYARNVKVKERCSSLATALVKSEISSLLHGHSLAFLHRYTSFFIWRATLCQENIPVNSHPLTQFFRYSEVICHISSCFPWHAYIRGKVRISFLFKPLHKILEE